MAYTIYDFTQEVRPLAVEKYKDEEIVETYIDRTSYRYRSLQEVFGNNTELIDKLYLQKNGESPKSPF